MATTLSPREVLLRRGLRLEYATLAWNVAEVGFVFYAAVVARSVALAGFALDSCIEMFRVADRCRAAQRIDRRSKGTAGRAQDRVRLLRWLAVYLTAQAVVTVAADIRPKPSPLGIAWLAATVVVMFSLAAAKLRTGRGLKHIVLQTEAMVTMVDGALAAAILVGLALNAALGWWWADVAAGIVVVVYGVREGLHAIGDAHD